MITTAPNAPMARAQATASAMARPGAASGSVTRRATRDGRSPSSAACSSIGRPDRRERRLRAQHVVRRRLVHLGDDQGQEGVGRGQVDVAEQLTDGRVRADHEDQQQADDQRRQQEAAQHARLPEPRERERAAGQLPGQRGTQDQQHRQRDQRPTRRT